MKTGIAYFGVRHPELAKVDLHQIKSLGYTHILHTISEEDLAYHQDSMREMIAMSRKIGLSVYVSPWGVGRVFGGEAFSEFAGRHPHAAQMTQLERVTVAACPNSQVFRDFMLQWLDFVASTEAETVFWDEPHFYFEAESPKEWACRCESCQKLYRKKYHHSMPAGQSEMVKEFRQQSLIRFVDFLTFEAKKRGKRNCVCFLAHHLNDGITNWENFASLESVDELATNPFWDGEDKVSDVTRRYHDYSKELRELANKLGKEAQMWVQNFKVTHNTEDFVVQASWAAYNEGIRNIFAWAYYGCRHHSVLRCDNPEEVWAMQTQAFEEIRARDRLEKTRKSLA